MMDKIVKPRIYIRRSVKYAPILDKVEQIASKRPGSQITSTIMDILELGLKSYESGLRVVEDKLLNINTQTSVMNVDREIARSIFTSLAGALIDMKRNEKSKELPDIAKINFYDLAAKALYFEHDRFRHFTNADVENVFNVIAPILKGIRLAESKLKREQIVEKNKLILQKLIDATGVTL